MICRDCSESSDNGMGSILGMATYSQSIARIYAKPSSDDNKAR